MALSWIGASFKSWSDSALLYESLAHIWKGETFKKMYGMFTGYMFWGRAAGALIWWYLYTINTELPFLFDIWLQTIYTLLAFWLTDTFVQRVETWFIETIQWFKLSYKEAFTRKSFAKIFVFSALIWCIARVTLSQYVQPYLEFQSVDIVRFWVIFAVYNVISGIWALFADRFWTLFSIDKYLILHAAVFGIFLSFLETTHIVWLSLLMLAVLFFLMWLYTPTVWTYVNKNVQSHNRTTMLSINSQLYTIGAAIVLFFTWLASDVWWVTSALYLLSTLSFVFLVAYVLVVRKIETD